jgi:tRNA pseudouridine(38-40) synthase
VETIEEQQMRELWETDPFRVARFVVDSAIMYREDDTTINQNALLQKISPFSSDSSSKPLSGFEYLFDPLYVPNGFRFQSRPYKATDKKDKVQHFRLRVAYRGDSFCGWQTQPNNQQLPSVQKTLEDCLDLLNTNTSTNTTTSTVSVRPNVRVAGRTDAGVHSIGQICRFRTRRKDLTARQIQHHLAETISARALEKHLRVMDVTKVSRAFHPTFTTSCRAYVYLVDIKTIDGFWSLQEDLVDKVSFLDELLRKLEGKDLDYIGLCYGKLQTQDSVCTLYHARAAVVNCLSSETADTSSSDGGTVKPAICIELVGNRFLRRMIRLLVEAAISLTIRNHQMRQKPQAKDVTKHNHHLPDSRTGLDTHALLDLVRQEDRSLISHMSPPNGLIFVGALLSDEA